MRDLNGNLPDHLARQVADDLASRGWAVVPHDPALARWQQVALPLADALLEDEDARAAWLRCGGTWFAGVNILPNGPDGAVPEAVPPLHCHALTLACRSIGIDDVALDRAQISICLPGYPQPSPGESAANFRFRRDRDAAHLDGLLKGADGRRRLGEVHGFILGIPLNDAPADAAPMVVWEGSHEIIRARLRERLHDVPTSDWQRVDLTDLYTETRRSIFETCRRVTVHVPPGSAYIVHRLAIHGVAPWRATAADPVEGVEEPTGSMPTAGHGRDGTGQALHHGASAVTGLTANATVADAPEMSPEKPHEKPHGKPRRIIAYFRPDPFPQGDCDWWLNIP